MATRTNPVPWEIGDAMGDSFAIIGLVSQAEAVQRVLKGKTPDEKVAWLSARGKLTARPPIVPGRPVYSFESRAGLNCLFFLVGRDLVFIGDNTTFSVKEPEC